MDRPGKGMSPPTLASPDGRVAGVTLCRPGRTNGELEGDPGRRGHERVGLLLSRTPMRSRGCYCQDCWVEEVTEDPVSETASCPRPPILSPQRALWARFEEQVGEAYPY